VTRKLVAPSEGEADTAQAVADELAEAISHIDHVDYDALLVEDLRALLDARETLEDICLKHRGMPDPRDEGGDP